MEIFAGQALNMHFACHMINRLILLISGCAVRQLLPGRYGDIWHAIKTFLQLMKKSRQFMISYSLVAIA